MHGRPRKKCQEAAETDSAALQNGKVLANYRHVAFVEIPEWPRRRLACNPAVYQAARVAALLHRHLRHAGQRLAIVVQRSGIADHEDLGMTGHGEILLNAHPPGVIRFRTQPPGRGRRAYTRGPYDGMAGE